MSGRLLKLLLYPVFALWLVIPWIRRCRRHPRWWMVRLAAAALGLVLLAGDTVLQVAGASILVLAALLAPVPDPDRVRRIAETLGARHTLNAGFFRSGPLPIPPGTPLLFLLSHEQLLIVPADRPDHVLARHRLSGLIYIRLDGEDYRPRYISFAKEPPRLDPNPDHNACSCLTLALDGSTLELDFQGVFAAHLAEVAAHTLYDLRAAPLASIKPQTG
jgi:hypothetical protein